MKYQLLFWTLVVVSLGIDSYQPHQSQAKPAPIFQPIVEEIRDRIPSDFKMRLPASLPSVAEDLELYAFIPDDDLDVISLGDSDREVFTVLVSETSDCAYEDDPLDCTVGIIGVTESISKTDIQADDLPSDSVDVTRINLGKEAQGFYFVQDEDSQFVVWKQDELVHLFIAAKCSDDCVSKQELINMARSAANEPAITSSNSGYYLF